MIRQLFNRLQGKAWGAGCHMCRWDAGRKDLTREQAIARAQMHRRTAHSTFGTCCRELTAFRKIVITTIW